jgi:hypothetical protein
MKTLQDRKSGTRLGVGFGAILLCVVAVGGLRLNRLGHLNSNVSASMEKRYSTLELTHQTRRTVSISRIVGGDRDYYE